MGLKNTELTSTVLGTLKLFVTGYFWQASYSVFFYIICF
jgi:hypothetical protein